MKALALDQPWASLVAVGAKTIETRPAPPHGPMRPEGVRGMPGLSLTRGERIAIVATQKKHGAETIGMEPWRPLASPDNSVLLRDPLPLGAVVCTALVIDALPMEPCPAPSGDDPQLPEAGVIFIGGLDGGPWLVERGGYGPFPLSHQRAYGDYSPGRWGWLLSDIERCEPIPCKGRQGVFALPDDVTRAIEATR